MSFSAWIASFFAATSASWAAFRAFSSSLAYYDGIRADRLPAALIQAQRDFFGAHTYRRVDKPGSFHTEWTADRRETSIEGSDAQVLPPEPAEKSDPTPA